MSRSRLRTPIIGHAVCDSEKSWKRVANRTLRRATKAAIRGGADVMPHLREVSDVWTFGKDGKRYYADLAPRDWRK